MKYVTYLRVSTQKQGARGLGIEAQRKMCADFIKVHGGELLQEFIDVESGTHRDRPGLLQAIACCKKNDTTLVVAKLDRLARDVEFCFKVVNTGIEIHFCDMPQINTLLLGVFASVAQYERELTSDRTTKALAAKKARGEKLGGQCAKWREAYDNKSVEEKHEEQMKRGQTKNERYLQSRDVQAFIRVLRNIFGEACKGEPTEWDWKQINTKEANRIRVLSLMKDYKEMDVEGALFAKWDLSDMDDTKLQQKLANAITSLKRATSL
jgi:DNA invertase Pin-like site-specific DNA recombinase